MSQEIESGFYEFRYSYYKIDGSLAVDFTSEYIEDKSEMREMLKQLRAYLIDTFHAKEPIKIQYKKEVDE